MAFTVGTYSINDVSAVVNGWTIQALASDKPLEITRTTPEDWKTKIGAKGEGTFVYQPDKSGNMIVRVKQNSIDDNKTLHALKEAGAIFVTEFFNTVTQERASSQFCKIGKIARIEFNSSDEADLEYEIVCVEIVETRGK